MADKKGWADLSHEERIQLFKDLSNEEILSTYAEPPDVARNEFEGFLTTQRELWRPQVLGTAKRAGRPPSKETIMGAWRDLNRSEALLELIDNSIDAWLRRKSRYARYTAQTLQIYIDIDEGSNILTYEDNAGGLREEQLENLVIPGLSDTDATEATIGSYRTGGKKAIFKLAVEANIQTYYLDPDGIIDEAFNVHLGKDWLEDTEQYEFPYYPVKNKASLEPGHTIYTLSLRDQQWDANIFEQITAEIRRTYTLLLIRNANIEIYFNDRTTPLQPLDDFYVFSGAATGKLDIRPQRVFFKSTLPWKGVDHPITIEVILGCRTTTGQKNEDKWGIDIYGNNRLFVHHNQNETFKWFELPTGNQKTLIRGLINIHGPNIFMPWDTHKRHLNVDREIVDVLKSKPIRELFSAWKEAYNTISGLAVKETVKDRYEPWRDTTKGDLNVAFSDEVPFSTKRKRGLALPAKVHKPKVSASKSSKGSKLIPVSIQLTPAEFRSLCAAYSIDSSSGEAQARKQLAEALKPIVLKVK